MTIKDNTPPSDHGHGCCAIFKGLFNKPKTEPQNSPPVTGPALPATSSTNLVKPLEAELTPTLARGKQKDQQATTIPDDAPVPVSKDDDPSQTSREERANAKFRNVRDELEKVIQNSNGASPIQLSFLNSSCSEIGNLSQMAQDIDVAISEFRKERDKQKESQKGKATAKNWVHKFSFAGQRILSTASSAASVGLICGLAECRNSSPPRLAVWSLVPLGIS
jgi:hypothetical protein